MSQPQIPLKIDLLRGSEISRFRIALGVLFFGVAAGWMGYKLLTGTPLVLFDAALFIVFILNSAFQLLEGSGISAAALVGKAYIIIDQTSVRVKPSVKTAERVFLWADIKCLDFDGAQPEFHLRSGEERYQLNLSLLSSPMKAEVRRTLKALARKYNIPHD